VDVTLGLEKGLEILSLLNLNNNLTVAEAARRSGLPRTTTLRALETLRANGYLDRDERTRRYRLTIKVRSLSDGFDDESWITEMAAPHLRALARIVVWPLLISTPSGTSMIWRENTDHESPLAIYRYANGLRVPLLESATGRIYLAFCTPAERSAIIELALQSRTKSPIGPTNKSAIETMLNGIRHRKYAVYDRPNEHEGAIAVPILADGRYLASLALRYIYGAMPEGDAAERYVPALHETANKIGGEFSIKSQGREMGRPRITPGDTEF
jgi:IclR family mhp operon transcriptional activator